MENIINKNRTLKIVIMLIFFIYLDLICFSSNKTLEAKTENDYIYLSDINYVSAKSGWGSILMDKTSSNTQITLMLNGTQAVFKKGIWAHATSEIVYDVSSYKNEYVYFTTYFGVNTTSGNRGNGVKFFVQTSVDGKTWKTVTNESPSPLMSSNDAGFVKIDIRDANYIKLWAHDNGSNGNDHSVWADAKLVKEGYSDNVTMTVEEYDALLKEKHSKGQNDDEFELLLLQREFVNNVGQYTLKSFIEESEQNKEAFNWLFNNLENLRLYIMGGKPTGSYYKSLDVLSKLYSTYKNDFEIKETTKYGNVLGDLYKRMAITLSLTHSARVALWMQPSAAENQSDAVTRYAIYKKMHADGKFKATDSVDITPWFETYNIEEMRYVMNTLLDDEETVWLNEYTQARIDSNPNNAWGYLTPHSYMAYVWPNYGNPVFYAEENVSYFDELFNGVFSKYNVTRGTPDYKLYKLWMNFRNKFGTGAVCGGISKSGHCIRGVHAIPSAVIGQPGHAALLYYSRNSDGKGYWGIDNDVSGWTLSEKGERLPLGWGNDRTYVRGYNVPYIVLAQEALNDYDNFEKAEKLVKLANIYKDEPAKKEELYREAISVQSINLDAWAGLVSLYNSDDTKTEEDYYNLAKEMMEALKCFPFTWYNLANTIAPKFTSDAYKFKFTLLQARILEEGKNYKGTDVLQPGITRTLSLSLLGQLDTTLASFSFDGEDAGKIILSSRFDGNGVRWDYSLDGKKTWKEVAFAAEEPHKWQLTDEEIKSITSENDIYIHIVGVNYSEENLYKIDIKESAGLPANLFANDLENRIIGAVDVMKWKLNENDEWTRYSDGVPDLTGDKTVTVKMGATGTYLESVDSATYTFTEDNQPNTRKYIPVSHLSINSVSSEATAQGRHAKNAIDANLNTNWHSAWNGSDKDKYIVIELDEPKNLTALEYFPLAGGNGKIESAVISVSMDGENWIEVVSGTDWKYANANDVTMKSVEFEPTKGKYIKIVGKKTQAASASMSFMAVRMFNLYENTDVKIAATFSFDGENAGEIILDDEFKNSKWKYSIDGGNTWKNGTGNSYLLTTEELEKINEDNKIIIHLVNSDLKYTINIKKGKILEISPYVNDLENRLIGLKDVSNLEWRCLGDNEWKSYQEEEPIVKGNRTLQVRNKAQGLNTASDSLEYNFTEDNQPETAKYLPIKYLSIADKSTDHASRGEPAEAAIDGNINTMWHTDHTLTDDPRFIVIKLEEPRYISKLQYVKKSNYAYGVLKDGIISTSIDGENWETAAVIKDLYNPTDKAELLASEDSKDILFNVPKYAQYVKLQCTKSCDYVNGSKNGVPYDYFFNAAMINLFEDRTKLSIPTADVSYNIKTATSKDVVATLVNPSTDITVTNNNGKKSYTFTENGEFTFEFVDKKGNKGKAKAEVNWIDKEKPTVKVSYDKTTLTNEDVVATLTFNEKVKILNKNLNLVKVNDKTYKVTFTENARYEVEFKDEAGNKNSQVIEVNYIDKVVPEVEVSYDITKLTNKDVVATLKFSKKVTIVNEGLNLEKVDDKTYKITFTENAKYNVKFIDEAMNERMVDVEVINIDRDIPTVNVNYNITKLTNKDVIATLSFSEKVKISNKDLNVEKVDDKTYKITFIENAKYILEFEDEVGNKNTEIIEVKNIDKVVPTASIEYSTTKLTNKDVVVKLVNASEDITITNNDGESTYTFTKNGEFTFEFVDKAGNKGSTKATVNNIDKEKPTVKVSYDITELTNKDVIATLSFSEKVKILNKDLIVEKIDDKNYKITFIENAKYVIEFEDQAGNKNTKNVEVKNIDKIAPTAEIEYSTTSVTSEDVIVTLKPSEEVTITNNDGKDTYTFTENGEFTFEFVDKAGNKGTAKAKVDFIDKKAPSVDIEYSTTKLTNKDVVATLVSKDKKITITNNNGKNTYTFTENGEFTFEFVDELGNAGKKKAKVNNIDKVAPTAKIEYNTTKLTNKDVVATLIDASEEITITNNDGESTYTFTENGEFIFEFVDKAGNKGTAKAEVNNIDKVVPTASVEYDITKLTNKNVVVKLVNVSEEITITNNDGKDTYTFTENGEFTFEFVDKAGNKGTAKAKVNNIDKEKPTVKVSYNITEITNKDVIATMVFSKKVKILNKDLDVEKVDDKTYKITFNKNAKCVVEFSDEAGNKNAKSVEVKNIDKEAPIATIEYSTTELTSDDVIVTLKPNEEVTILNNDGKNTYTFTKNGEFTFEFVDKAGNKGTAVAKVDFINKNAPITEIEYSTTELTNKDVVATLICKDKKITITNNGGKNTYTFTENGEFTFEFVDESGNVGKKKAKVNNIDKVVPTANVEYDITKPTNKDVVAKLVNASEEITITNNDGKDTYTFTENGEFTFEFVDKAGNKGTAKAEVSNIDREAPTASIEYDITKPTNKDVVAKLVNASEEIKVTNNDGKDTYTFTENGEFTFEFVDEAGNKGTAKAKVNNIDKEKPTVKVSYNITEITNKDVIATMVFSKKVKILNKDLDVEKVDDKTYKITFKDNAKYAIEFTDELGNSNTENIEVKNIDKVAPEAEIEYSTTDITAGDVIVTLKPNEEVIILNNDGKDTYTFTKNGTFEFKFKDKAGNIGTAIAKVDFINKNAPIADIEYSTTKPTNKDVIAKVVCKDKKITVTNNGGKDTYIFTENGEFTFEFVDELGNVGRKKAKVTNIDKKAPTASIEYSITEITNKDVIVTLVNASEEITITNNDGKNTYTFTENGEFTFEFVDKAGNVGTAKAKVDYINKDAPTATIKYNITKLTNKDVVATLVIENKDITITNNDGKNTYTFTKNGEFTFEFVDKAGNKGTAKAKVDYIDKEAPTAKIKYSITKPTNKNVVATLVNASEKITITNNNGKSTYTFTKNGEFTFEFVDEAGNKGTAVAKVDYIDKGEPKVKLSYNITTLTNKDVIVKLVCKDENIKITNNKGKDTYTFTKNGEFTFKFVDEAGNAGEITAKVDYIDKEAPTAKLSYNINKLTNKDVVVKLVDASEDITITNNSGKDTYTFTKNGEFTFEFVDKAGNKGIAKAKVDYIDKIVPTAQIEYSITEKTNKNVVAKLINPSKKITVKNNGGKNTYTFTQNGEFTFEYVDEAGNVGKTVAKVDWIVNDKPTDNNNNGNNSNTNNDKNNNNNNTINNDKGYSNNTGYENNFIENTNKKQDKDYSVENVKVTLKGTELDDDARLNVNKIKLDEALLSTFGHQIEGFELYFVDKNNNKCDTSSESVLVKIKIDRNRVFRGISKIVDEGVIEHLNYNEISEDEIEIEESDLGQYILRYEDESNYYDEEVDEEDIDDEQINNDYVENNKLVDMEKGNSSIKVCIAAVVLVLVFGVIIFFLKKYKVF